MSIETLERTGEVAAPVGDDAAGDEGEENHTGGRTGVGRWLLRAMVALIALLVVGNGLILASTMWFRWVTPASAATVEAEGIDNLRRVDAQVIRGAAPSEPALRDLAAAGVTTVVDLRAEAGLRDHADLLDQLGMVRHQLPIRDGQLPTPAQAAEFLEIVDQSEGAVLVHCGAGVGRTGAMTAFYLNATGQTEGTGALAHNLSVGPPSLEQILFSVSTADGDYERPGVGATVLSRVLDGPRRIWHNLT